MQRGTTFGAAGLITSIAVVMALALAPAASAVYPDPNPWLQNRLLVMAHQGGEDEAPSNTMFALKSAIQDRGADSLELDVNLSKDGQLMVIHDDTWKRIACTDALCPGPDASTEQHRPQTEVNELTLAELQALDAGYWFRPGSYSHDYSEPDSAYPYRGMRTGDVPPPPGYTAQDFEIPTLRQVLNTFPDIPINIEIKMIKTTTGTAGGCTTDNGIQYCDDPDSSMVVADKLAALLNEAKYASRDDLIVVSFSDALLDEFHRMDGPPYVALAPGVDDTTAFGLAGTLPDPDVAAFQVPPDQMVSGHNIQVPELLLGDRSAHCLGYAVHIWTNGDQDETPAAYERFYNSGADGVMTSKPSQLRAWMEANGVTSPDGRDPLTWPKQCPVQRATPTPVQTPPATTTKKKCKKAKKRSTARAAKKKWHKCKKAKKR
ncbi:MAG TPA: glycerophosphodiester phosphodiesterase family protein [Solirubrobacterales bacterium]|jgi:glycerophosphoryl diester phosphodiesterase|nr:glycerophosphodiester phosphodiesterase family protein [Solirubrobacterales bacterium]